MRAACTDLSACLDGVDGFAFDLKSVPHTGQRTAVSDRRVPQVGQTWVFCDGVSGLIRAKIIPQNKIAYLYTDYTDDMERHGVSFNFSVGICEICVIRDKRI